jgi:hypothetical protein
MKPVHNPTPCFFEIRVNKILPSVPESSKQSLQIVQLVCYMNFSPLLCTLHAERLVFFEFKNVAVWDWGSTILRNLRFGWWLLPCQTSLCMRLHVHPAGMCCRSRVHWMSWTAERGVWKPGTRRGMQSKLPAEQPLWSVSRCTAGVPTCIAALRWNLNTRAVTR